MRFAAPLSDVSWLRCPVARTTGQDEPVTASWGARVETAIGKTALVIRGAAEGAKAGTSIVDAASVRPLLAELAERFTAEGVRARVYRGYASDDPETPGLKMCLDLEGMQDACDPVCQIPSTGCEKKIDG